MTPSPLRSHPATRPVLLLGSLLLFAIPVSAQTTVLYNATAGTTPGAQGSLVLGNVGAVPATETFQTGPPAVANLNSSANQSTYAGYSNYNVSPAAPLLGFTTTTPVNPAFPALNAANGFTLSFTMQLVSESHTNNDRAGFSVLLLGSDKKGIEIGFQSGGVFSQSTAFTQAETNFGPTLPSLLASLTAYDLRIQGSTYTLLTGNTTLLTGAVRDYTGAAGFGSEVYRTSNFVFLGDDTTSAGANINLARVSITANTAAPEPGSGLLALLGAALPAAAWLRRRERRANRG